MISKVLIQFQRIFSKQNKLSKTNQQNADPRIHLSTALLIAVAGNVIRQIRKSQEVRLKMKMSMTESRPAHRLCVISAIRTNPFPEW